MSAINFLRSLSPNINTFVLYSPETNFSVPIASVARNASCILSSDHDEDISKAEIIARGIVSKEDYEQLEKYTLALYQRGCEKAAQKGLILVDTKYEFGKIGDKIILIDEIHTPDSSRYFYAEGYEDRLARGEEQRQLSKEFVRQWLIQNGFQGKEGQQVPEMTEEYCNSVSDRYIELYEHIVGEKFVKAEGEDVAARIEKHVTDFLNNRKK